MSALAAIFRRDRGPVSEASLRAVTDRLGHRGPDGSDLWLDQGVGVAHLHGWVTPEESGERQPLRSEECLLAFDGRLDNRRELLAALDPPSSDRPLSDAELVMAAHAAWSDDFCSRLIGPFALALFEPAAGRGLIARDPLGDRSLFYADLGQEIVIASEEHAVLGHPGVSGDPCEARQLAYFALEVPSDGSTFFRAVTELLPGSLLQIGSVPSAIRSFWSPPDGNADSRRAGDDLAEEYLELLRSAVVARLRSTAPAAILMSGGLDSTSLAALAAESSGGEGGTPPRAVSWVFDDTPECDERALIRAVVARSKLEAHEVVGDGMGPLPDDPGLGSNPSSPEENSYRRLKTLAYSEAARAGSIAVLTGGSADALYSGFDRWFADLISAGRPVSAVRELAVDLWRSGPRVAARRAGLGRLRGARRRSHRAAPWLTPQASERLASELDLSGRTTGARTLAAAGPAAARSISLEVFHAARCGIDLRHPYRDLRLVEFMLGLPAYHLYRHGRFKDIARRALAGRLPERVRLRTGPTLLTPLFDEALRGSHRARWEELLWAPDAGWRRYVRRDWLSDALDCSPGAAGDVVLWNCLALELWQRRFGR